MRKQRKNYQADYDTHVTLVQRKMNERYEDKRKISRFFMHLLCIIILIYFAVLFPKIFFISVLILIIGIFIIGFISILIITFILLVLSIAFNRIIF